ncbi:MAG TPA: hypothetical protein GXZ64_07975 [Clostridiaceae bacterium]|jgi:hypothetical protein|nr:hypothetical protein [Clostridiaceae bacterium]
MKNLTIEEENVLAMLPDKVNKKGMLDALEVMKEHTEDIILKTIVERCVKTISQMMEDDVTALVFTCADKMLEY